LFRFGTFPFVGASAIGATPMVFNSARNDDPPLGVFVWRAHPVSESRAHRGGAIGVLRSERMTGRVFSTVGTANPPGPPSNTNPNTGRQNSDLGTAWLTWEDSNFHISISKKNAFEVSAEFPLFRPKTRLGDTCN
jgi:hypothetical protein